MLQPRATLLDIIAAQRVAEASMKACMLAHVTVPSTTTTTGVGGGGGVGGLVHALSSCEVILLPVNRARVDVAADDADLSSL